MAAPKKPTAKRAVVPAAKPAPIEAAVVEAKLEEIKAPQAVQATVKEVEPVADAPEKAVVTPKVPTPRAQAPKAEAPKQDIAKKEMPKVQAPKAKTPEAANPIELLNQVRNEMFKNYQEAIDFNKQNVEAVVQASNIMTNGAKELASSFFGYVKNSIEESVQASQALMKCKDIKEAAELQSKLVKEGYEKFVKEAGELSASANKLTEEAVQPLSARLNVAFESLSKLNKAA